MWQVSIPSWEDAPQTSEGTEKSNTKSKKHQKKGNSNNDDAEKSKATDNQQLFTVITSPENAKLPDLEKMIKNYHHPPRNSIPFLCFWEICEIC